MVFQARKGSSMFVRVQDLQITVASLEKMMKK